MTKIRLLFVISVLMLLVGLMGMRPVSVRSAAFVVNSNNDTPDWLPGDGLCTDSWGDCTLRAAIEEANATSGIDIITFNAPMTITLSADEGPLPVITETLTIDASNRWNSTKPGVVIDGNGMDENGLYLAADDCEIYGLYIRGFGPSAIRVTSANNQIGGTGVGQRNVLSGNASYGLWLDGVSAQYNQVQNNYMGTAPDGVTAQPNQMGVGISEGASYNTIGGSTTAEGNLISGNSMHGVYISGMVNDGNGLGGNTIGLDVGGTLPLPNSVDGVNVEGATDTYIGGGSALAANLIGENGRHGVFLG
ncbi:MAG: CSLREA domain-containing protein, partial [Anaerolineae bacterium]